MNAVSLAKPGGSPDRRERAVAMSAMLGAMADHVSAPGHGTWLDLLDRARDLDARAVYVSQRVWAHGVGDLAEALIHGDHEAWAGLFADALRVAPGILASGDGARLKDISPFADRALFLSTTPGMPGELRRLFASVLGREGYPPGTDYLIALAPSSLSLGPPCEVRVA